MTNHVGGTNHPDAALEIARHVSSIPYQGIPQDAIVVGKKSVMDTVGVILAGTGAAAGLAQFDRLVKAEGGNPESSVLGFGGRVPATGAAFINGASSHVLDYDDTHDGAGSHPSSALVPALLALAERLGKVDGKDFLAAVALGHDVFVRLVSTLAPMNHGLQGALSLGGLAVAAGCSRLLGLDAAATFNALGIAACRSGGTAQITVGQDSDLRGFYNAFPAREGLVAALLAQRGIGGISDVFEGSQGLFRVLFRGAYDRDRLLEGLGSTFPATDLSYKPWPSCRFSHPYIDATLRLVTEHGIGPQAVESVVLTVGDKSRWLFEPDQVRRRPRTAMDAKFSLPFIVGLTLVKRDVTLGDFSERGLADEAVLRLAGRVSYRYDASFNQDGVPPGEVEVRVTGGQRWSARVDLPYGNPTNPMAWPALRRKFLDCAASSVRPIPAAGLEQAMEGFEELEQVNDIGALIRLLDPDQRGAMA